MHRRSFLLAAPAGVLVACGGEVDTQGPAGDRADLGLLRTALGLEESMVELYTAGIELAPRHRSLLRRIREHEREHADGIRQAIIDLRGNPPTSYAPLERPPLRDERAFLRYALEVERNAAESYAAALPRLRTQRLRGTLGSLLATEAEHASALAEAAGEDPLARVLAL